MLHPFSSKAVRGSSQLRKRLPKPKYSLSAWRTGLEMFHMGEDKLFLLVLKPFLFISPLLQLRNVPAGWHRSSTGDSRILQLDSLNEEHVQVCSEESMWAAVHCWKPHLTFPPPHRAFSYIFSHNHSPLLFIPYLTQKYMRTDYFEAFFFSVNSIRCMCKLIKIFGFYHKLRSTAKILLPKLRKTSVQTYKGCT